MVQLHSVGFSLVAVVFSVHPTRPLNTKDKDNNGEDKDNEDNEGEGNNDDRSAMGQQADHDRDVMMG
jgi:hypothetical protein